MHTATTRWTLALLSSLALACTREELPLGASPLDRAPLVGNPLFAHYQETLSGVSTVADLFKESHSFVGRPTPHELLRAMQADNPPAVSNAVPVSVLSYNVAMLDVTLFGFVPYTSTPALDARREVSPRLIFSQGYDIIGLQEVWSPQDLTRFRSVGEAMGYTVYASPRRGYTDGLVLAVRRDFAPPSNDVMSEQYAKIDANEYFPAPGFSRGFLAVRVQHATLGPVVAYVTHTAAFPSAWPLRLSNVRELGLHVQSHVRADEVLFVMGDLNATSYYRADTWALPNGDTEPGWYSNTLSYPVLMHYTGTVDLAVRGRNAANADLDITAGDTVPNVASAATSIPYGTPGYCATIPREAFSATDCNPLYFQQYAGTEPPARLDYVFGRAPNNRIHVAESRLVFTEPVAYGSTMGPLSDHYGQLVRLLVAPR